MADRQKILVLFAHPVLHKSRTNRKILEHILQIEDITVHNLYDSYPDFHIDVKYEQKLLLEHDIIVWQHPFYWYSSPSMIKEWIDLVLEHGFAYGSKGKALANKVVFNAITTGGRAEAYTEGGYNSHTINQFMAPFRQTAKLCNMIYLPPHVIHGTHLLNESQLNSIVQSYMSILISLRDNAFRLETLLKLEHLNDILTTKQ